MISLNATATFLSCATSSAAGSHVFERSANLQGQRCRSQPAVVATARFESNPGSPQASFFDWLPSSSSECSIRSAPEAHPLPPPSPEDLSEFAGRPLRRAYCDWCRQATSVSSLPDARPELATDHIRQISQMLTKFYLSIPANSILSTGRQLIVF